jgi:hypothetical protein
MSAVVGVDPLELSERLSKARSRLDEFRGRL